MKSKPDRAKVKRPKERRIVVGLVFAFLIMLFAAFLLLAAASEQEKTAGWVEHSRDVLARIDEVVHSMSDAENGRRGFVISGEDRYLAHFTNAVTRAGLALEDLREMTRDNPAHTAACDQMESLIAARLTVSRDSITARRDNGPDPAVQTAFMEAGQAAMEPIRSLADRMRNEETRLLLQRRAEQRDGVEGAKGLGVLVSFFVIFLFPLLLILLRRANRRRLAVEAELAQTNKELEQRVHERTAELEAANRTVQDLNETLEQRIRERTDQLEQANKEMEAFSYSVSHDLRAPLRHIQGYAEMLQRATEGQLSEKAQRFLRTINDAGAEMGQFIDDLLAFSRIGRMELQGSVVPLDPLIENVIRDLEPDTAGRNIQWNIAPLPEVLGDPTALEQVFTNLIGNALKYSRHRDPARIEIGTDGRDDGNVILFVRDNGAGFDMSYAHKLFGVFQRLHRSDEFEGTGIGLATVRRVVARHGGRTWAEGVVNEGAVFYLTLKLANAESNEPSYEQHGTP